MNDTIKSIVSEFLVKLEKYLSEKSSELEKQNIANTKLLAQIEDSKDKLDEIKRKEAELINLQIQFQREKDMFNEGVKEFEIKKKALDEKARRVQAMFDE